MTRIYLVRHAEAEGNLYRIAQGQDNSNLTDRGWRQVRALERRFADVHIDAVYSSDLYRTCATASAIYKPKGLPLIRERGLREISVGAWERLTWGEILLRWPEQLKYFGSRPDLWQVEGAETAQEVLERGLATVKAIAAKHDGQTIALVAHGYIIRLVTSHLQGYRLEEMGKTPTGDNTCVALLEYEGGELRVIYRDDNSHLKTPEFLATEKVVKRATAMEPGLRFCPLDLPEQADLFCDLAAACREEGFDRERLLADAALRPTLIGYLRDTPVGILQTGPEPDWISLLCIHPDYRKRGFGVQLLGQAVYAAREKGFHQVKVIRPRGEDGRRFCADYGFLPAGETETGSPFLRKETGFDPEIWGEDL